MKKLQKRVFGVFGERELSGQAPFKNPYQRDRNVITVRVFGSGNDRHIKVADLRSVRNKGQSIETFDEAAKLKREVRRAGDLLAGALGLDTDDIRDCGGKLRESIIRARSKIFELAYCNPWEFFFTGTLDEKKFNRFDLETFHKQFSRFIKNLNEHRDDKIKYLVVPETHKNGAWHFHGFLMGLPADELHRFQIGDRMSLHIAEKVYMDLPVYDWPDYSSRFGFCDLEPIRSREAVSAYVTKYVSKTLGEDIQQLGAHLYYRSRGLQGADRIGSFCEEREALLDDLGEPTFCGDFGDVWWLPYDDILYNQLEALCIMYGRE